MNARRIFNVIFAISLDLATFTWKFMFISHSYQFMKAIYLLNVIVANKSPFSDRGTYLKN